MTVETFNSSTTWACPVGVTSVDVECWGGGGSGGIGLEGGTGGGGGGGAYAKKTLSVTPGNNYTVTVGAGGISDDTIDGEASWFSTTGTVLADHGDGGGSGFGSTGVGGDRGRALASIGDVLRDGGNGADGQASTGGGGGGSATASAAGNAGSGATGGTGEGNGATATTGNGANGSAPGGGGAGQGDVGSIGGNGAAGRVVLTYTAHPILAVTGTADNGTYALGSVALDTNITHQFTIQNTGSDDTLGTLLISGTGWSISVSDNPSGNPLVASGSTTVTVVGNFSTAGVKTGILTIPSNDTASPYVINLTATAIASGAGTPKAPSSIKTNVVRRRR